MGEKVLQILLCAAILLPFFIIFARRPPDHHSDCHNTGDILRWLTAHAKAVLFPLL